MTIYGKYGNVRFQAEIKGIYWNNENNLWRNLWQSGIIYGSGIRSTAKMQVDKY